MGFRLGNSLRSRVRLQAALGGEQDNCKASSQIARVSEILTPVIKIHACFNFLDTVPALDEGG